MAETYRVRVRGLIADLTVRDGSEVLETHKAIPALVDRMVLTPSAEDPRELMLDLEGVLASLYDHRVRSPRSWRGCPQGSTTPCRLDEGQQIASL